MVADIWAFGTVDQLVALNLVKSPIQVQSRYEIGQKNDDIYSGPTNHLTDEHVRQHGLQC